MQATHLPWSQSGVPASAEQSALTMHSTHMFRPEQTGVCGVLAQSGFVRHWTQVAVDVSHFGVGAEHCPSFAQLATHVKSAAKLHSGFASGQLVFLRHPTHSSRPGWHSGFAAGHCELAVHSTHCLEVGSHTLLLPVVQSADVVQPTH